MPAYALSVLPQHQQLLADSAIDPDVARERGYLSADTKPQLAALQFSHSQRRVPGLVIPIHDATGAISAYQYRPDTPRVLKDGKPVKYETRSGGRLVLDIPVRMRDAIRDPAVPLWITEGSRKVDAAVSQGLCCIGLLGVSGWRGTNEHNGKTALPQWADVALSGRRVYVCFDSDAMTKQAVHDELGKLGEWLKSRGAEVRYAWLPASDDGKTGLDDYIAASGSIDELVTSATPELKPIARTPIPPAHTRTPAHPPAEQGKQECGKEGCARTPPALAAAPDLLANVVATVHQLGVTGEERIIRGTYLTAVSQVLGEPASEVVKGTSAAGKSYSTRTTLRLIPTEDLYIVTAASQRALIYTEEEFAHRTIVMFEATALREVAEVKDGDMFAMLVRTLLSEGRIIYDVAERGTDGKTVTRRIEKTGPTNLIITTTAASLHSENETRLLSLDADESEEQTRAVMIRTARRRSSAMPAQLPDLKPWLELFHWLKHHGCHDVYIPFAEYLAEHASAAAVRMRRDFGVLLGMIEASAVLHQATRGRDGYGRIIATAADYAAARDIVAEAFAVTTGQKVIESVRNAVQAVHELGPGAVTIKQVASYLGRDRTRITRALKEAAESGYVENTETRKGYPHLYVAGTDKLPDDKPALPAVLPDDEGCAAHTPESDLASSQVSEGCAGVRPIAGDTSAPITDCALCGLPLDPVLISAGFTDHGEEANQ